MKRQQQWWLLTMVNFDLLATLIMDSAWAPLARLSLSICLLSGPGEGSSRYLQQNNAVNDGLLIFVAHDVCTINSDTGPACTATLHRQLVQHLGYEPKYALAALGILIISDWAVLCLSQIYYALHKWSSRSQVQNL